MLLLIGKILRFLIKCIFFVFSLFCFVTAFAKTTLDAFPYQGDKAIIAAIQSAKHDVQITMYGFTDEKIAKTLIQKQQHGGVAVQLLIEHAPYKATDENSRIIQQLKNAGIDIRYTSEKFSLTHQKTMLIDKQYAFILTGNFTYSAFYRQRNFMVTTDDPTVVENMRQLFDADWNQTPYFLSNNPVVVTSPENTWLALNKLIHHTQQTLDIYALELTDKRIIHALLKQKATIRIIVSGSTKMVDQQKLCRHHIAIHQLNHREQHAKALLRDAGLANALAYVGSANLSYPSLSKNREVGLLFSNREPIQQLHETFEKDWMNSRSICGS
jgi:phosphatidylserine/phosphatidylglycerophosphate/cardiolipin synthase-like enzyme